MMGIDISAKRRAYSGVLKRMGRGYDLLTRPPPANDLLDRHSRYRLIRRQDILDHVNFARQLIADARKGGKTAVLIDKDLLGFGLSRMRETYFDMEGVPVAMQTFTDIENALEWLGVKEK